MKALKPSMGRMLRYSHIIGTGGIGSGIVFSMEGNHTLGRNESRLGKLEPFRDYCKLHIIMHYIAVLLGAGKMGPFQSFPIGRIGKDDQGYRLRSMMEQAGMDTSRITVSDNAATLFSVCYQYPDYSGGNITSSNSASNLVNQEDITSFFQNYQMNGREGIVLAVPEVPVETRISLLSHGKEHGLFNVASVLSSELEDFVRLKGFELTSLLAINIDEARHISGIEDDRTETVHIVRACTARLNRVNPELAVLITDGVHGSYCYYRDQDEFTPSLKTTVVSTAGAGDAFLAGTICGICCGLPLFKGFSNLDISQSPLRTAVELGTVLASLSVSSADTIHEGADALSLEKYIHQSGLKMSPEFKTLF
ncbi:MAG: PfkB family carbohydrate kinase [Bacteroidota bacterium]